MANDYVFNDQLPVAPLKIAALESCRELAEGNIAADPFWRGPEKNACRFCDYAAACLFEEGRGGDCRRGLPSVKSRDFWKQLEEETDGEDGA